VGREKAVEELVRIDRACLERGAGRERLGQMAQADEQQEEERNRGEQRVECERASQKRDVVFVGGLQRA
jgi:hypothetical protein